MTVTCFKKGVPIGTADVADGMEGLLYDVWTMLYDGCDALHITLPANVGATDVYDVIRVARAAFHIRAKITVSVPVSAPS